MKNEIILFSFLCRIGIVLMPDKTGWTKENKIKYGKKQVRQIEQNTDIGAIIIDESKWSGLKAYEKALVFYTKIVNMLVIHRRNKLKELTSDF